MHQTWLNKQDEKTKKLKSFLDFHHLKMPVRLASIDDVIAQTRTPKDCIQILYRCGVLSRRKTCLHCSRDMCLMHSDNDRYQTDGGWVFRCRHCKKYRNIRSGTVFDKTKKPLSDFCVFCVFGRNKAHCFYARINKSRYISIKVNMNQ